MAIVADSSGVHAAGVPSWPNQVASTADVPPGRLRFGRFEIDFAQRQLLADGVPPSLGARTFDVLRRLVTNRGRVVSRNELMDIVRPGVVVEENNLSVQIGTLRRLLGLAVITTVAGRGCVFTATVPAALKSAVLPANEAVDGAAQPRLLVPPLDRPRWPCCPLPA
jgi:DNA-binding winged helix-turn-helix (wHTH) protein